MWRMKLLKLKFVFLAPFLDINLFFSNKVYYCYWFYGRASIRKSCILSFKKCICLVLISLKPVKMTFLKLKVNFWHCVLAWFGIFISFVLLFLYYIATQKCEKRVFITFQNHLLFPFWLLYIFILFKLESNLLTFNHLNLSKLCFSWYFDSFLTI